MTNRNTTIFIGALGLIAILLGVNYFTTPFYGWFEQLGSKQDSVQEKTAPEPELDAGERFLQTLTPEQKIAQLIAYPLTFGETSEVFLETDSDLPQEEQGEADIAQEQLDEPELKPEENQEEGRAEENLSAEYQSELAQIEKIVNFEPGFVTVFGSNISFDEADYVLDNLRQSFKNKPLMPLIAVDHEGGTVQRLSGEGFTQLSSWQEVCRQESEVLQNDLSQSAQELQEVGINIIFAPVVDLGGSILGDRSCNSLEELLPAAGIFIRTFGQYQIMPVVKHFPGIGNTTQDLHTGPDEIVLNPDSILVYSRLLEAYPNIGVMSSHVKVEGKFNGLPCSLSKVCLNAFEEQYSDVLVFSDAMNMGAIEALVAEDQDDGFEPEDEAATLTAETETEQFQDLAAAAKRAILAGNDVLVFGYDMSEEELASIHSKLVEFYREDPEFAQQVDASLSKIVSMKSVE